MLLGIEADEDTADLYGGCHWSRGAASITKDFFFPFFFFGELRSCLDNFADFSPIFHPVDHNGSPKAPTGNNCPTTSIDRARLN